MSLVKPKYLAFHVSASANEKPISMDCKQEDDDFENQLTFAIKGIINWNSNFPNNVVIKEVTVL